MSHAPVEPPASIGQCFDEVVSRQPDAVAVVDGDDRLTYAQLAERRAAFQRLLTSHWDLGPGHLVAAFLPNCWEFVACFLAVAETGATFLPLSTNWRAAESRWFVEQLPITGVVTTRDLDSPWQEAGNGPRIHVDAPEIRARLRSAVPPSDRARMGKALADLPAVYNTTSGSTGRPKIVPRTHRMLIAGASSVAAGLRIGGGERILAVAPLYHGFAFTNCLVLALLTGATLVIEDGFIPNRVVRTGQAERVEVLILSPVMLKVLAAKNLPADAFSGVRLCLSGGAPMPRGLAAHWRSRFGVDARDSYGATETGLIAVAPPGVERPGTASLDPIPGVEIRIVGPDGCPCAPGEIGEVAVRSPSVMNGYVNEPRLNAAALADGFFRTGDLGRLEGGRLLLAGRKKRMIIRGGLKVDPVEIENAIKLLPGVRGCRVLAGRDSHGSEIIHAVIAGGPDQPVSRESVIAHCRRNLAEYKIPQEIDIVEELPRDALGKS